MARKFSITIDKDLDPDINVQLGDVTSIMFKQWSGGLYYYDTTNTKYNIINIQVNDYTFLNTVESNKAYFRQREIKGAYETRIIQQLVGWTSTKTLK